MNKQKIEQKIEELQKQLDELKKAKIKEPIEKWIEEIAQKIMYTMKYNVLLKKYIEEHSEPLDWEDKKQKKWYISYCACCDNVTFDYTLTLKVRGIFYASSEQILKDAINYIGEENMKKYVFGDKIFAGGEYMTKEQRKMLDRAMDEIFFEELINELLEAAEDLC